MRLNAGQFDAMLDVLFGGQLDKMDARLDVHKLLAGRCGA